MTDVHGLIRIVTSAAGGTGCAAAAAAAGVDGVDFSPSWQTVASRSSRMSMPTLSSCPDINGTLLAI